MFSAGVTAINDLVAWNLTDAGDAILLGMPIYGDFHGDLTERSGYAPISFSTLVESNLLTCRSAELLYVPMQGVDPFAPAAIEKYEASLQKAESRGINVRALWLCNPHNPLGAFASIDFDNVHC